MSKGDEFDTNIQKYYIVTRPTRLSDLHLEDIDQEPTVNRGIKRGRRLRERRLARIKHQLD